MARLRGFTITESIIAMAILSIMISIGSYFSTKSLSIPNRATLIEVNSLLNQISNCRTLSEFEELQNNYSNTNLTLSSIVTEKSVFADVEFSINQKTDTLFSHFIVLQYED